MLETLQSLDLALMHFLNVSLANPVTDWIMPILTNDWFVRIFFGSLAVSVALIGGRRGRVTLILLVVTVVLTDQLSAQVIKPWVGRLRPCRSLEWVHVLVNCGAGKSFPSSHAANALGQAAVWIWRYPKFRWFFGISALLIAYSRIPVGMHYPLDVLAGSVLGGACGGAVMLAFRNVTRGTPALRRD